jgi:hypothetical protein
MYITVKMNRVTGKAAAAQVHCRLQDKQAQARTCVAPPTDALKTIQKSLIIFFNADFVVKRSTCR